MSLVSSLFGLCVLLPVVLRVCVCLYIYTRRDVESLDHFWGRVYLERNKRNHIDEDKKRRVCIGDDELDVNAVRWPVTSSNTIDTVDSGAHLRLSQWWW